jgi:hypothetical protein
MKKSIKYMLICGILWFLLGIITTPYSLMAVTECHRTSYSNITKGFMVELLLLSIFLPGRVAVAVSCMFGSSRILVSIFLPPIIGFFYGILIGFIIFKIVNLIRGEKHGHQT